MTETTTADVTDEQLLDLYLTAWVAGAIDSRINHLPDNEREHIVGCKECTQAGIDYFTKALVTVWEDPAARAEHISVFRAVLAREDREPKFIDHHHVAPREGN